MSQDSGLFKSIRELTLTLENYIYEGDLKMEQRHDSVISALLNQIKYECEEGIDEKPASRVKTA